MTGMKASMETGLKHKSASRQRWKRFGGLWLIVFFLATVEFFQPITIANAQTVRQMRFEWTVYSAPPGTQVAPSTQPGANLFIIVEDRLLSGHLPRQRTPRLTSEQLVVLATDADGKVVDLQLVPDPRILRAEFPGPTGELSGTILHHTQTELLLVLPDDARIKQLKLYYPRWTGTAFVLDLLGTIPLN
jgi:hypothetical protein